MRTSATPNNLMCFVTIGLLFPLSGCYATRGAARRDVASISHYQEQLISEPPIRVTVHQLDSYLSSLGNLVLNAAQAIRPEGDEDKDDWKLYDRFSVYLVHSASPNAGTWGENHAYVTSALFLEAETAEEVVGVLAHELGHILCEHQVQKRLRIRREWDKTVALGAALGALSGAAGAGLALPMAAIEARKAYLATYEPNRQEDEFEADDLGLKIYMQTNLPALRFTAFFVRCLEQFGEGQSQTHPRTSTRIERINRRLSMLESSPSRDRLDEQYFRKMQSLLASHLVQLSSQNALYSFENVFAYLKAGNYVVYPASACGAFDVDPTQLQHELVWAVESHLGY